MEVAIVHGLLIFAAGITLWTIELFLDQLIDFTRTDRQQQEVSESTPNPPGEQK